MKFKNFPIYRIEWVTSTFLILTALLSLTVVPWFLWTQYTLPADAANKVHERRGRLLNRCRRQMPHCIRRHNNVFEANEHNPSVGRRNS